MKSNKIRTGFLNAKASVDVRPVIALAETVTAMLIQKRHEKAKRTTIH